MEISEFPDSLRQLVEGEVERGERILWAAQPTPRTTLPWFAFVPVLFSIPWTLFSLFWMAGAAGVIAPFNGNNGNPNLDNGRLIFAMFGIPFVLVGIGMMTSPYWIRRRIRRTASSTAYVITDRRAIIFDGGFFGDSGMAIMMSGASSLTGKGINIRSYPPDKLGLVQRNQQQDGSGDVIFGEALMTYERNGQPQQLRGGFFSIPEVKNVEKLLTSLAETTGNQTGD